MISIRDCLHTYAATLQKTWEHDRSSTVGASEVGQCARKVWFDKHDAPRDPDYVDGWGARVRGTVMEDAFWLPAMRATLPEDVRLLYAGEEQHTLVDGYLSATTDGLLVWESGYSINLDCKTIDSRADLREAKPEHTFQTQVQMGLFHSCTEFKPLKSILSYIEASFWDNIREFVIQFSPKIYEHAKLRARMIMTAPDALGLPPEGKFSGGRECNWCPWASHCAQVTVAGVPKENNELDEDEVSHLEELVTSVRVASRLKEEAIREHALTLEEIKQFLREYNVRKYKGSDWSVSYSVSAGRATLDIAAIEASGFDLSPYYKTGNPYEKLSVK